jgi:hypothetical protein
LKWQAASSGGMTLLSTTSMSGAATTVSGISGSYKKLVIYVDNWYANANAEPSIYLNGFNSTSAYRGVQFGIKTATLISLTALSATSGFNVATGFSNIENSPADNFLIVEIDDYADTSHKKPIRWQIVANAGDGSMCNAMGFGTSVDVGASAITSFSISTPSGTFSAGEIRIYGVS